MSQEKLKQALLGAIETFKQKPDAAKVVFRADTEWVRDLECRIKIRDFPAVAIDEPAELGGGNISFNPVELVLGALGTCQEIMYGAYASVMGIPLTKLKVECKGYLDLRGLFGMDPAIPSGLSKVHFKTTIESPAGDEAIQQLIKTVESHCPVLDTLTRGVEVTGEAHVNGRKAVAV